MLLGTDLHRESVFIVVSVAVHVMADQFLAVLVLDRNHRLEEFYQSFPLERQYLDRLQGSGVEPCSL